MNITDIDDKILNKVSKFTNTTDKEYWKKYINFVRKMEEEFWEDLKSLDILMPSEITRVTDYINNMKHFVEKIEDNNLAYTSNGSVYFDTNEYINRGYKIPPFHNLNNDNGYSTEHINDKKNSNDFALWKKSKSGELSFHSKWGDGRPGWHLECSTMAYDKFGDTLDIHSGGIDLKFPHYQNEILQTNAYLEKPNHQWIKYFLHAGHLNIDGLKMSKSLKNFITIKDYLENVGTSRELRLLFLTHNWDKSLDYNESSLMEIRNLDNRLQEFIDNLSFSIKEENKIATKSGELFEILEKLQKDIEEALNDNFNTVKVMDYIYGNIPNIYNNIDKYNNKELIEYSEYILEIIEMFGLDYKREKILDTDNFIKLGINLREDIRKTLLKHKKEISNEAFKELFTILDDFRDVKMANSGIIIQDRSNDKKTKYIIDNKKTK